MKQTIDQSPASAQDLAQDTTQVTVQDTTPEAAPAKAQAPAQGESVPADARPASEAASRPAAEAAREGTPPQAAKRRTVETKRRTSRTVLLGSLVLACLLTIGGLLNIWDTAEEDSSRHLTDVIGELDKSHVTIARAWTNTFESALLTSSDNSDFCEFVSRVSGMGLPRDVLLTLTGRAEDRQGMLNLLGQRRSAEELKKLREFADMADTIQKELTDFTNRYNFKAAYLFTREGVPCMGSGGAGIPRRLQDISKTFLLDMTSTSKIAYSQPAYVTEGRLHVDIAAPMVLTDKQKLLAYNVGVLVVTVDLGNVMDGIQAVLNQQNGVRLYILEEQPNDSLIVLSASNTQKVPLEGWPPADESIPFGLRRLHGESEDAFVLGRRLLTTNLFLLTAMSKSSADNLGRQDKGISTRLGVLVSGTLFVVVIFLLWMLACRVMKRRFRKDLKVNLRHAAQESMMLSAVDRDMGIGIVCIDFDKNILFANDSFARLSGRKKAGELQDLTTNDLPQDLAMDIAQHTGIVWERGKSISTTARLCDPNGQWKTYGVHASPYVDSKDFLTGLVVFYSDISKRLQGEQREEALMEQTVGALHRLINSMDPYLGRLCTLVSEMAVLVAELDNDRSPRTAKLLTICGRIFVFGNTAKPENQILRDIPGTNRKAPMGLPLMSMDFDGLPVAETLSDIYERLDGSGAPRKVTGAEISKPSRYLAIAEEVCSSLFPRTGEAPADWTQACQSLLDKTKFDPVAEKLFYYLKTPQGAKIIVRLCRR